MLILGAITHKYDVTVGLLYYLLWLTIALPLGMPTVLRSAVDAGHSSLTRYICGPLFTWSSVEIIIIIVWYQRSVFDGVHYSHEEQEF